MAGKPHPVRVLYCAVCGLPAEYCEFGPDFQKCKPWLVQNAPDLYPDLVREANEGGAEKAAERLQSVDISGTCTTGGGEGPADSSGGPSTSKLEEIKRLPGGKIKKKEEDPERPTFFAAIICCCYAVESRRRHPDLLPTASASLAVDYASVLDLQETPWKKHLSHPFFSAASCQPDACPFFLWPLCCLIFMFEGS